jgi:hypothetical protein
LNLSLSLTNNLSLTASPSFNPLSLFAAAEKGVWYDPSDLTTLYQSGTRGAPGAAVTADGDPVGLMLDKSGNQFDATQATGANRFTYRAGSGKPYLESDGTKFFNIPQVKASVSDWSMTVGLYITGGGNLYQYLFDSPTGRLIFVARENATNLSYYDGVDFRGAAHALNDASEVLTWVATSGSGKVRAAGADVATGLAYTQRAISGATKLGCNTNGAGDFFGGRLYGLILVDRAFTAGEITNTEALMAAKL